MKVDLSLVLLVLMSLLPINSFAEVIYSGYLEGRAEHNNGQSNWLQGGAGTQGTGGDGVFESRFGISAGFGNADEGIVRAKLTGLARREPQDSGGDAVGILEAFVDYGSLTATGYRFRAGMSFSGTSRENIEEFWQTPYTLTLSALNSWIGEEFRPIGIDFTRRVNFESGSKLDWSLGSYVGNDTGPAILTWRGYALHNRLSVYGEVLPLPDLFSLTRTDQFAAQRNEGTQPFGPDLDGRVGYSLRVRYEDSGGPIFSAFYTDNRGDQDLHDNDEYAWNNRFFVLGADFPLNPHWRLIGETQIGSTKMGFTPGANVQADFQASYLLLSYNINRWVLSARIETFEVKEQDFSAAELNDQDGSAATLALLYRRSGWLYGIELQHADINRIGNALDINPVGVIDTQQGGNQITLVARRYF